MERPRGERQPAVQRRLTAEMMYLFGRWRSGQQVGDYNRLPDTMQRMYEQDATILAALDDEAAVLDVYKRYDDNRSELSRSCTALAEALLSFRGVHSDGMQDDFVAAPLPQEVLAKIRALRVGDLLASDDEQLAIPSDYNDSAVLDIRKADAVLTDVYLRVWKSADDRKYALTSDPGVEPQYPRDFLAYPANEVAYHYHIEVSFEHYHPTAEIIQESVNLYIDGQGRLGVDRDMYIHGFGGEASDGAFVRALDGVTEQDIAAFADVIAEIVGDQPVSAWRHDQYNDVSDYISRVPNGLMRAYLTEWLDNTSRSYVRRQLAASTMDGSTLHDWLLDPGNSDARDVLMTLVNYDREARNEQARVTPPDSDPVAPWRDRIPR